MNYFGIFEYILFSNKWIRRLIILRETYTDCERILDVLESTNVNFDAYQIKSIDITSKINYSWEDFDENIDKRDRKKHSL